jgi:hypothetical protein
MEDRRSVPTTCVDMGGFADRRTAKYLTSMKMALNARLSQHKGVSGESV